jgi:hypothetical protein
MVNGKIQGEGGKHENGRLASMSTLNPPDGVYTKSTIAVGEPTGDVVRPEVIS